jgi:hypothetical protein
MPNTKHLKGSILVWILVVVISVVTITSTTVRAQSSIGWSVPQRIPGLKDTSASQYPVFVADQNGAIHVFHSQRVGDRVNIVYSQWTVEVGWSHPVDVIASPWEEARLSGATLDQAGMIDLAFWGGNDLGAAMYFTKAPAVFAGQSNAWAKPTRIGRSAISPTSADLAGDGEGFLAVVYSGNILGNGLYYIYSLDSGITWSEPFGLFLAANDQLWPYALQLYLADDGRLHAVWALADLTGNSVAVYYARLSADRTLWSNPIVLAEAIGSEADTPSIIEYQDELFVIYHNNQPTTRWMRRSVDGGDTWTTPTRLFEQVGSNGAAALVVDSGDRLHMLFGNRIDSSSTHGLWHSTWFGKGWTKPEAIITGQKLFVGLNGGEGFDPSFAQTVISQGNLLFVAWRHDPGSSPASLWYVYQILNSPQIPKQTLPVPVPTNPPGSAQSLATPSPDIDQPSPGIANLNDDPFIQTGQSTPNLALAASLIPVFLLIVIVVVIIRIRN